MFQNLVVLISLSIFATISCSFLQPYVYCPNLVVILLPQQTFTPFWYSVHESEFPTSIQHTPYAICVCRNVNLTLRTICQHLGVR